MFVVQSKIDGIKAPNPLSLFKLLIVSNYILQIQPLSRQWGPCISGNTMSHLLNAAPFFSLDIHLPHWGV